MVNTGGILTVSTNPRILYHAPMGATTDNYDFDGQKAKLKRIKLGCTRVNGQSTMVYLQVPGESTNIILVQVNGQTAASGADGESMSDEWKGCLTVPAGTKIYWQHGTNCYYFLCEFELLGS